MITRLLPRKSVSELGIFSFAKELMFLMPIIYLFVSMITQNFKEWWFEIDVSAARSELCAVGVGLLSSFERSYCLR